LVEPAVVGEKAHPGIDAQQERGPEGQDDQKEKEVAPGSAGPGDRERHRVADQEADEGRDGGIEKRIEIAADIDRVRGDQPIVLEADIGPFGSELDRWLGDRRLAETDHEDDEEGEEKEQQKPEE